MTQELITRLLKLIIGRTKKHLVQCKVSNKIKMIGQN